MQQSFRARVHVWSGRARTLRARELKRLSRVFSAQQEQNEAIDMPAMPPSRPKIRPPRMPPVIPKKKPPRAPAIKPVTTAPTARPVEAELEVSACAVIDVARACEECEP